MKLKQWLQILYLTIFFSFVIENHFYTLAYNAAAVIAGVSIHSLFTNIIRRV